MVAAASVKVLYNAGSASSAAITPSKRLAIKPALRDARFTTLFTMSAFTRCTKSSRFRSISSMREESFAV
ncbi:hypothetical protein D3C86_1707950 [compost metagenome]